MEANELRIGNYVNTIYGIKKVSKITVDGYCWFTDNQCEPIPITEEWLLKFGFVIRDKSYSINYGGESMRYAMLEKSNTPLFMLFFHGRFGFNTEEGRKNGDYCIQYVHQLQNLYFALTGEELIFKQ